MHVSIKDGVKRIKIMLRFNYFERKIVEGHVNGKYPNILIKNNKSNLINSKKKKVFPQSFKIIREIKNI